MLHWIGCGGSWAACEFVNCNWCKMAEDRCIEAWRWMKHCVCVNVRVDGCRFDRCR